MSTLLLRLAAPLQAWGVDSKFEIRKTCREASKSGVIGLLSAALGRRRDDAPDDLNALRFGLRVDQEGKLLQDFHMARKDDKTSYVTKRHYLADAVFLVGMESDDENYLQTLEEALKNPVFPLFLGRRSCPPTQPLCLGIRRAALLDALREEPWQAAQWRQKRLDSRLRLLADCADGEFSSARQQDVPVSFDPNNRQYGFRALVDHGFVDKKTEPEATTQDPMLEL